MSRVLTVVEVNPNCTYVSGFGSRELLTDLRGKPPVWSVVGRAWVVRPRTARDAIAVAESRGWVIQVSEGDPLPELRGTLW